MLWLPQDVSLDLSSRLYVSKFFPKFHFPKHRFLQIAHTVTRLISSCIWFMATFYLSLDKYNVSSLISVQNAAVKFIFWAHYLYVSFLPMHSSVGHPFPTSSVISTYFPFQEFSKSNSFPFSLSRISYSVSNSSLCLPSMSDLLNARIFVLLSVPYFSVNIPEWIVWDNWKYIHCLSPRLEALRFWIQNAVNSKAGWIIYSMEFIQWILLNFLFTK